MDPITIDTASPVQMGGEEKAILHVLVIGFHHKKGSQVDYCYPPLSRHTCYCPGHDYSPGDPGSDVHKESVDDDDQLLPEEWKPLASLSLPDGAHNFSSDSVFFHLPMVKCGLHGTSSSPGHGDGCKVSNVDNEANQSVIYGISCYRQVVASDSIKESDSSITRTTVMKAVVVLSRLPFYGLISAKVDSITRVYFGQKNFSNKLCLIELYNNLNYVLSKDQRDILSPTEARLLSLSPTRYLLKPFGHRILVLIKLLLLEKKVLFFSSFNSNGTSSGKSPVIGIRKAIKTPTRDAVAKGPGNGTENPQEAEEAAKDVIESSPSSSPSSVRSLCLSILTLSSLIPTDLEPKSKQYHLYCTHCQEVDTDPQSIPRPGQSAYQSPTISVTPRSGSFPNLPDAAEPSTTSPSSSAESETIHSLPPINLFDFNHNHLHPYLDLSFIDAVANYNSCLIGATNGLYKQKKSSLFDVTVDVVTGN